MEQLLENENMPQEILEPQSPVSLADKEASLAKTEQENIRRLREKSEQKEREYQHQLNALKQELEQAKKAAQSNINDDDIVEGRHIKPVLDRIEQLQTELVRERQANDARVDELRIKAEIPQAEQIINERNLGALKERYPHLYNSIFATQNLYERAKIAHTLITEMNIGESAENDDRMNYNSRKPQTGKSVGLQQKYLYDQYDLSSEEKANVHAQAKMYASRR